MKYYPNKAKKVIMVMIKRLENYNERNVIVL